MTYTVLYRWSLALLLSLCMLFVSTTPQSAHAQSTVVAITGTITDSKGGVLQNAVISVKNETTANIRSIKVDAQGHFLLSGLTPAGISLKFQQQDSTSIGGPCNLRLGRTRTFQSR